MGISSTVSGSNATTDSSIGVNVQKKAQDVQSQQVLKILESSSEQTQEVTAQKTGIGSKLNISA